VQSSRSVGWVHRGGGLEQFRSGLQRYHKLAAATSANENAFKGISARLFLMLWRSCRSGRPKSRRYRAPEASALRAVVLLAGLLARSVCWRESAW
jgi:hypothetical protein